MSRILTILAVVVVLGGLGAGAYFYFFKDRPTLSVTPTPSLPAAGDTSSGTSSTPATEEPTTPVETTKPAPARLAKIDAGPVVPGVVLTNALGTASTSPAEVRTFYIARQSGNVFSYANRTGALTRTSNRTLPGVQEATWLPDASVALVRYLSGANFSTINTYALHADGSNGTFLSQNIAGVAAASSSVLAIASGVNGSIGTVMRPDGTRQTQVFTTALSMIRGSFAGKNQYLVFTKASATEDGYAFIVDAKGNFSKIAGPLRGLVALASPSGRWLLISSVTSSALKMELIDTITREVIALPIGTIVDKCAWSKDEASIYCGVPIDPPSNFAYPDDWYQGAVHFSDRIWKIDVPGRFAQLVLDFSKEAKVSLDATAIALDPSARILVFLNKNDGSLWSYQL